MDYTNSDIIRYMDTFPGDCVLYEITKDGPVLAAYSEHIPSTFGFSKEEYLEMRSHGVFAGVLENDRSYVYQKILKIAEDKKPADIYFRVIHKFEDFAWLHTKGKVIGTFHKNTLIAVEYLNAEFETENLSKIMNCDRDIVYICDTHTKELLYANQAALKYWGRRDYIGKVCYEFIKGIGEPCACCGLQTMENGEIHIEELYDSDLKRWLKIDGYVIHWYGREAYYQKVSDITEMHRGRELLEADNTLIRRITQSIFEFIAIINVKERIIRFRDVNLDAYNAQSAKVFDYDEDNQRAIKQFVVPEEQEYCRELSRMENIVAQLEEKKTYAYSWTQPGTGGNNLRKQFTFCWLDEEQEEIIVLKSDITAAYMQEQKQMQKLKDALLEAELANSAKSRFLSSMSHDMRTPLNGILGLSELMADKTDPKEIRDDLAQLKLCGRYLLNLINDTLDVSKIEKGQLELHPVVCDGRSVLANALRLLRPNMDQKKIQLVVHADNLPFTKLYIDVGRVEQLVMNIFSNAIKFTPEGGRIEFIMEHLSCHNGVLRDRVTVRDNGIGMSEEFLPNLFKPFSQEHGDNKSEYQGTGLGMTIAKQIVGLMGGEISVKSEPGRGTEVTFTLDMPIASEKQAAQYQRMKSAEVDLRCLEGKRVLLCEDNSINAQIAIHLLKKQKMCVDWAENGLTGVEKFRTSPVGCYDMVLMDIRMPVMDGFEAAKSIRAMDRPDACIVPIIAMTANAFEEDRRNSLTAGMDEHLSKPIEPQVLFAVLAEKCRRT